MKSSLINGRKTAELKIIREFLSFMGYRTFRVAPRERPDAIATITQNGKSWKIGIEQTEYHVDALPGTASPGRNVHLSWSQVRTSIKRRISHRPNLAHVTGFVSLKNSALLTDSLARPLASELVRLALDSPVAPDGQQTVTKFSSSYPLLNFHVQKVILRHTGAANNVSWVCGNASASTIGLSENSLICIVKRKGIKSHRYSWNGMGERWLLISASGMTVFNSSGTRHDLVNWSSTSLKAACQKAAFDRIYFWDRMYGWCKEVWPGALLIQKSPRD